MEINVIDIKTEVESWGTCDYLHISDEYMVRRLTVWPGQKIYQRKYNLRDIEYVIVSGFGRVLSETWKAVKAGSSVYIKAGINHRVINTQTVDLVIVEVGIGICRETYISPRAKG